ncbi:hypothetical protein D3C78_1483880 [compost metagenome]
MYQAVQKLTVTELRAGTAVGENVRGTAHVFLAARDDNVRLTALNRLRRQMQRFQTRSANIVNRNGRHRIRQTAFKCGLTRRILPGTCRQHLAQNYFVDFMCGNSTALYQGFKHHAAQIHRSMPCQRPLKTADSRT